MEDESIIELYFERCDDAIAETERKYGGYCYSVAYNILRHHEDSEECVNDTWLRTWNSIPPERPSCLRLFLAKITRNLSLDKYRRKTAKKRGGAGSSYMGEILDELGECAGVSGEYFTSGAVVDAIDDVNAVNEVNAVEDAVTAIELRELINRFLGTLSERDRAVFLRRYFYGESIREIAEKFSVREENARKILFRTREKLKKCLEKEGYTL